MKDVGETQPICGLSSPLLPVFRGCVFKSRINDNQTKISLINAYLIVWTAIRAADSNLVGGSL